MSTKNIVDVEKILLALMAHIGARKYSELAAYLGIKYPTLMRWKERGSVGGIATIVKRIPTINVRWLITGEGKMLREETTGIDHRGNYGQDKATGPSGTNGRILFSAHLPPSMVSLVKTTIEVMESGTTFSQALEMNINAFGLGVKAENEKIAANEEKTMLKEEIRRMARSMEGIMEELRALRSERHNQDHEKKSATA